LGSTATAGADFEPFSGTLTWPDQDSAPKTFDVTIIDDVVFEGDGETVTLTLDTVTGGAVLATPTGELNILDNDPNTVPTVLLYFSTLTNFTVPGVAGPYDDADIYSWDGSSFSRVFDASAAGLPNNADIDAMAVDDSLVAQGEGAYKFYMSFARNAGTNVPQLGTVQDEDIVLYDQTTNTWTMFFDGSDVGLSDNNGEDVDAFEILSQGGGSSISVLISTVGNPEVGVAGDADEDLLRCDGTSGANTSCDWSLYFDASDIGLGGSNDRDIEGASVVGADLYFTTIGVNGLGGDDGSDVMLCAGHATLPGGNAGVTSGCSDLSVYFDGSANGVTDRLDAIDRP
jgi:hypothetical protein